jgi:hypothetical protein
VKVRRVVIVGVNLDFYLADSDNGWHAALDSTVLK